LDRFSTRTPISHPIGVNALISQSECDRIPRPQHGINRADYVVNAGLFCVANVRDRRHCFYKFKTIPPHSFWINHWIYHPEFFHFIADLIVPPTIWYQVALMVILFAIGLLLNLVSFRWMREQIK
jgi:hypothetical protein